MIPGAAPWFPEEDRKAIGEEIAAILAGGRLTQGPHVEAFESAIREMAGTRHAIAVNSGGCALELALEALDIAGGEVILPVDTFVATANAVVRAGGTPVFADISPATLCLAPEEIERRLNRRTRGIVWVHMFGILTPDLLRAQDLCADRGLFLLEDAAHAHGASLRGKRAGSLGTAACFSYYATKILATGEGGAVTTDRDDVAASVRSLRNHGLTAVGGECERPGNNFRLAEIPAVLGVSQQKRLGEFLSHRRALAALYRERLQDATGLTLIDPEPRAEHSYWRYAAILPRGADRRKIQAAVAERADARVTWMYEPLLNRHPFYRNSGNGSFPVAEDLIPRLVNLPLHPGVTREDARQIAESLMAALKHP